MTKKYFVFPLQPTCMCCEAGRHSVLVHWSPWELILTEQNRLSLLPFSKWVTCFGFCYLVLFPLSFKSWVISSVDFYLISVSVEQWLNEKRGVHPDVDAWIKDTYNLLPNFFMIIYLSSFSTVVEPLCFLLYLKLNFFLDYVYYVPKSHISRLF